MEFALTKELAAPSPGRKVFSLGSGFGLLTDQRVLLYDDRATACGQLALPFGRVHVLGNLAGDLAVISQTVRMWRWGSEQLDQPILDNVVVNENGNYALCGDLLWCLRKVDGMVSLVCLDYRGAKTFAYDIDGAWIRSPASILATDQRAFLDNAMEQRALAAALDSEGMDVQGLKFRGEIFGIVDEPKAYVAWSIGELSVVQFATGRVLKRFELTPPFSPSLARAVFPQLLKMVGSSIERIEDLAHSSFRGLDKLSPKRSSCVIRDGRVVTLHLDDRLRFWEADSS